MASKHSSRNAITMYLTANGDTGSAIHDVAEHLRAVPVGRRGDHRVPAAAGNIRPCGKLTDGYFAHF